jgi:hypothetical protein
VSHDDGMRMLRRLWRWTRRDRRWRADGDGRRTWGKVDKLHVSGLSPWRRKQGRVCAGSNSDDS